MAKKGTTIFEDYLKELEAAKTKQEKLKIIEQIWDDAIGWNAEVGE